MLPYTFADEPFVPPVPPFAPPSRKGEGSPLSGKRAVIVEDEGITQLQIAKILRSESIEVVGRAANGQDAIEIVLRERPDFVLMDIKMPVMNGLEASERILAEYRVCIILLTAFSDEEYRQRAQELGTCGYVLKPITSETLLPEVEAAYYNFHLH